jgi:hypothetical protein
MKCSCDCSHLPSSGLQDGASITLLPLYRTAGLGSYHFPTTGLQDKNLSTSPLRRTATQGFHGSLPIARQGSHHTSSLQDCRIGLPQHFSSPGLLYRALNTLPLYCTRQGSIHISSLQDCKRVLSQHLPSSGQGSIHNVPRRDFKKVLPPNFSKC